MNSSNTSAIRSIREMGLAAHESVRREFLSNRHLQDLLDIVADLVG